MKTNIWIKQLMKTLDERVDVSARTAIMESCGEKCPFTHLPDEKLRQIKRYSRDEEEFLENLCRQWRLRNENGEYYVVFDQCYCPLVNENTEGASKTLCFCTLGNIKHKFAIGLDRVVEVVMEKSVLAGDDECRFHIKV
jgi:hypothetical protein